MTMAEKPGQQSADEIDTYFAEAKGRARHEDRSAFVAYILWLVFGTLFAHRFYLGRWKSAVALIALLLGAIALLFLAAHYRANFVTGAVADAPYYAWVGISIVVGIVWLIDLFLIPSMVKQCNHQLALRREALGMPTKASYQPV
jgi:hypothetical protein